MIMLIMVGDNNDNNDENVDNYVNSKCLQARRGGPWKTMIIMMMEVMIMAIILIKGPRQGAPLRSGP